MDSALQLELFEKRLPSRPYCTNELLYGIRVLDKIRAIEKRYIQPNHPHRKCWLPYDVDSPWAGHSWQLIEPDAPAPNIVIENPINKHAHLLYGLAVPVYTSSGAHLKPLRYAAAIDCALQKKLGADPDYSGLIIKNPLSESWNVYGWEDNLYDLDWLADYLDLENYCDRRRRMPDYGLGRNCTLFEHLRRWAYRAINRNDWGSFDNWMAGVFHKSTEYNDFKVPLPLSELKSVSKSIGKWVWKNFSSDEFSRIQANRGKMSQTVRKQTAEKKRLLVLTFPGWTSKRIEAFTGIPAGTVRRLRSKGCSFTISDNSTPKSGFIGRKKTRDPGQVGIFAGTGTDNPTRSTVNRCTKPAMVERIWT